MASSITSSLSVKIAEPFIGRNSLPTEIWQLIINYLAAGRNLRHITAMAFVSKEFLHFCVSSFPVQIAFGCIGLRDQLHLEGLQPTLLRSFKGNRYQPLAIDQEERHYYSAHQDDRLFGTLLVTHPENDTHFLLDLPQEVKIKRLNEKNFVDYRIVSCHPYHEGFVVVTSKGYGVWEWDQQGQPIYKKFSFLPDDHSQSTINSSSLHHGKLIVQGSYPPFLSISDLKEGTFLPAAFSKDFNQFLMKDLEDLPHHRITNMEGESYLCYEDYVDKSTYFCKIQIKKEDQSWTIESANEAVSCLYNNMSLSYSSASSPTWTMHFVPHFARPEWSKLKITQKGDCFLLAKMPKVEENDHCLIYKDFLFVNDQEGSFDLIHLPTHQRYALNQIAPVLQKYLKQQQAILLWPTIKLDHEGLLSLDLRYAIYRERTCKIYSLKIPISQFDCSKDLSDNLSFGLSSSDSEDVIQADCDDTVAQNPQQKVPHVVKKSTLNHSPKRDSIILITGVVLLILTSTANALLIALHPGRVIFQGNGITLTLPTILTLSYGGSCSLLLIAMGSYEWWKNRRTALKIRH